MFKFNSGKGAIICDQCRKIIAENVAYTARNTKPILCAECKKKKIDGGLAQLGERLNGIQ